MKYQLETIPVHDAWASGADCPVCALMNGAEKRHIEYYLGNSVMNPETRVLVNQTGFCGRHFSMMAGAGHPHHLGLLSHTRLRQVRENLAGFLGSPGTTHSRRFAAAFYTKVNEILQGCLICRSMKHDLQRYTYTAVVLHKEEQEFRDLFNHSGGPCLAHAADLAAMAAEALGKAGSRIFISDLSRHLNNVLDILESDILRFTQKFDSQNDGLGWNGAENAPGRVVQAVSGRIVRLKN